MRERDGGWSHSYKEYLSIESLFFEGCGLVAAEVCACKFS